MHACEAHISVKRVPRPRAVRGVPSELKDLSMVEGAVLEVRGANGVLRIDLSEDELRKMLFQERDRSNGCGGKEK